MFVVTAIRSSKRGPEKEKEMAPSPSMGNLQRTPKQEHQSRKRTTSQSSNSLSSGASSGKEGGHSTKNGPASKHRREDKQGRSTREGKVRAHAPLLLPTLPLMISAKFTVISRGQY